MSLCHKWLQDAAENSHALDLHRDAFKGNDPREIAQPLKRAEDEPRELSNTSPGD